MQPERTAAQILIDHPGPWRHTVLAGGRIVVFDVHGREVQLFDLIIMAKRAVAPA